MVLEICCVVVVLYVPKVMFEVVGECSHARLRIAMQRGILAKRREYLYKYF